MTNDSRRIEDLKARHAELESALDAEAAKTVPDQATVATIKKQKLRIKDEIARLEHA